MLKTNYLGCMTGTSCDGLDIAFIQTDGKKIINFGPNHTFEFTPFEKNLLKNRINKGEYTSKDLEIIDFITEKHLECIQKFIIKHSLSLDYVGFHGQTVFHDPTKKTTIQLGNAQKLATKLNIPVVANFRLNDIKNGGQGAPLAPIYHLALAQKLNLEKPLVFLNIGGVSNITFIGKKNELIASDIGPGNALIDDWMQIRKNKFFDFNGYTANSGQIHHEIIHKWSNDPFFAMPFPKSLDRQYFHKFLTDIKNLSTADGAATLSEFTIYSIKKSLQFLPKIHQIVICGGGCYNLFFMNRFKFHNINAVPSYSIGINTNAVEAELIAYLASRFIHQLPSSFCSTTGAHYPTIAGKLFLS